MAILPVPLDLSAPGFKNSEKNAGITGKGPTIECTKPF